MLPTQNIPYPNPKSLPLFTPNNLTLQHILKPRPIDPIPKPNVTVNNANTTYPMFYIYNIAIGCGS